MAQAAVQSAFPLDKSVSSFLGSRTRKLLIDGKWVEAASGKGSLPKKEPPGGGSRNDSTRIARMLPSLFVVLLFADVMTCLVLSFLDLGALFGSELPIRLGFRLG